MSDAIGNWDVRQLSKMANAYLAMSRARAGTRTTIARDREPLPMLHPLNFRPQALATRDRRSVGRRREREALANGARAPSERRE